MKIPEKVIAGGITYTVKQDNAPINKETNTWGITQHDDQIIFLDPKMSEERRAEVFLHEILHVVFCQAGLSYMMDNKKELNEEEIINSISRSLYPVLKNNNLDFTQ